MLADCKRRSSLAVFCICSLITYILCGCEQKKTETIGNNELKAQYKEPLVEMNKSQVQLEHEQIDAYVKRHGLKVVQTGTGLRYMIYQKGNGKRAEEGLLARVNYKVNLLNGKECYKTEDGVPEQFLIGKDNVESGLHEGITFMRVGDKAKLILPSYLAHGLIGDQDKIPMKSTIIYDIELVALDQ